MTNQKLFVKEANDFVSKPLNQLRTELEGFWMLVIDIKEVNDIEVAIMTHYGTDREALLDIWETMPDSTMYCNKRSNWVDRR